MGTVLKRLMEAAEDTTHRPRSLTITGKDQCLSINQHSDSKSPWMLGFVKSSTNSTELEISTIKYVGKVGSPRTRKLNNTVSVYTLLKCLKLDLEDNRFLSSKVTEELLEFGDFVIETNKHSKVNYKLTQSDIDEYNHRNPKNDLITYIDDNTLSPTLSVLIPLINHLETTQGFRWVYRQLSGTEVEGLTKIHKLTFIDYLFIGALQARNNLHGRIVTTTEIGGVVNVKFVNNPIITNLSIAYHPDNLTVEVSHSGQSHPTVFKETTKARSVTLTSWDVVYGQVKTLFNELPPLVQQHALSTVDDLIRLAGINPPDF